MTNYILANIQGARKIDKLIYFEVACVKCVLDVDKIKDIEHTQSYFAINHNDTIIIVYRDMSAIEISTAPF